MRLTRHTKKIAITLLFCFLIEIFHPLFVAYSLTGGPSQPEVQSFEPIGTSEMVDLFSGDFNYNIPLLDVGGYPINIAYHAGITPDQEASWVGLGWNINPGAITRNTRGLPDEFNGDDKITQETNIKPDVTVGFNVRKNFESFGLGLSLVEGTKDVFKKVDGGAVSGGLNFGISYNNYRGIGISIGGDISQKWAHSTSGNLSLTLDGNDGIITSAGVGLSGKIGNVGNAAIGIGPSVGATFNSRKGLVNLNMKVDMSAGKKETECSNSDPDMRSGGTSVSSNISFNGSNYIPRVNMPMRANSFTLGYSKSSEYLGVDPQYNYQLDFARTKLYKSSVSKSAYGYLHQKSSETNDKDNKDFVTDATREKDGPYVKGYTKMYIPSMTYDIYSVSGQGLGGMFRPYRNDIGVINEETQKTVNRNFGLKAEYGVKPAKWRIGLDGNFGISTNKSNNWIENNRFLENNHFDNDYSKFNEPVYFKYTGEGTPVSARNNIIKCNYPQNININKTKNGLVYSSVANNIIDPTTPAIYGPPFDREVKNTVIKYIDYNNIEKEGTEPHRLVYYRNSSNVDIPSYLSSINSNARKPHHLAEIINTNTDGTRYVYGIAAYNTTQEEHTFNVSGRSTDLLNGYVSYIGIDDTKDNGRGNDHYYNKTTTPPFAHSYLLTEVLSPDYVDIKGDGVTDDDAGTAVKLNYTCASQSYKWRVPYDINVANFNEGLKINKNDNMASYTYGEKEEWYLKSIVSKGQIAIFTISKRDDGCGVADNAGGLPSITSDSRTYKLDKIELFNKYEYENSVNPVPIKVVHFEYTYELCKNINNNIASSGDKGKLTLHKIWFSYGNSEKGALTPYIFEYNSGTLLNPSYNFKSYDRWGNYQPNTTNLPNSEWSYTDQNKTNADNNANVWNLKTIHLPSGGKINITYEADDYAYVQDKQAMEMFMIEGVGSDANYIATNRLFEEEKLKEFKNNLFVYFKFKKVGNTTIDNLDYYKQNIDDLFFNIFTDFPDKALPQNAAFEKDYVRGYVNKDNITGWGKCINNGDYGYIQLKAVSIGNRDKKDEVGDKSKFVNPLSKVVFNHALLHYNDLVYPYGSLQEKLDNTTSADAALAMEFLFQFAAMARDIKTKFRNINRELRDNGFGETIELGKSWIRLNSVTKHKLGGGYRVKKIELDDNWSNMSSSTYKPSSVYGQEYIYETTENSGSNVSTISSGVASSEPQIGGEENAMRKLENTAAVKHNFGFALSDNFYNQETYGESFYPSPSVGYSKVTVKSLSPNVNATSSAGYSEYEFYTAKDYPTIVDNTPLEKVETNALSDKSIFKKSTKKRVTYSQGYVFELNDMHGKPKSVKNINSITNQITSGSENYYHDAKNTNSLTNQIFGGSAHDVGNRLINNVSCIMPDNTITTKEIGVDYDFWVDMQERSDISHSGSLKFNFDDIPVVKTFMIFPTYNKRKILYRTAITNKVIQRYGILDSVVAYKEGTRITTKNLLYDGTNGNCLLTQTTNEFNDPIYNFSYPAHWIYDDGMGAAYKNLGFNIDDVQLEQNKITFIGSSLNPAEVLVPGDEVLIRPKMASFLWTKAWVYLGDGALNLIDEYGKPLVSNTSPNGIKYYLKVIRSGRRNLQFTSMASLVLLKNPIITSGSVSSLSFQDVVNAAAATFDDVRNTQVGYYLNRMDCDDLSPVTDSLKTFIASNLEGDSGVLNFKNKINFSSYDNSFLRKLFCNCNLSDASINVTSTVKLYHDNLDVTVNNPGNTLYATVNRVEITFSTSTPLACASTPCSLILDFPTAANRGDLVLIRGAFNYSFFGSNSNNGSNYFIVTLQGIGGSPSILATGHFSCDCIKFRKICVPNYCNLDETPNIVVNPFRIGIRGVWFAKENYAFNGERQTLPNDIRNSGKLINFASFYTYNTSTHKWSRNSANSKWISTSTPDKFTPFGEVVEEHNALNIYSSSVYGYNYQLPIALAANARYQQIGYDGFEDYNYNASQNFCPERHFTFEDYLKANSTFGEIDGTVAHSGKFSIKVPGSSNGVEMKRRLNISAGSTQIRDFQYVLDHYDNIGLFSPTCEGTSTTPLNNRYVLSAWVKEGVKVADTSYVNATIEIYTEDFSSTTPVLLGSYKANDVMVEGWQRLEYVFELPYNKKYIKIVLKHSGDGDVWFDDIRIHPEKASFKSFAYNKMNNRLMAELDDNNFATFYEYDVDGKLVRVKKETNKGIQTLKENREGLKRN